MNVKANTFSSITFFKRFDDRFFPILHRKSMMIPIRYGWITRVSRPRNIVFLYEWLAHFSSIIHVTLKTESLYGNLFFSLMDEIKYAERNLNSSPSS